VKAAAAVGTLATFVTDEPYTNQRLGTLAPGILRDFGDVPHIAALVAPKRIVIAGGVGGNGKALTPDRLRDAYKPATQIAKLLDAEKEFKILDKVEAADVIAALK